MPYPYPYPYPESSDRSHLICMGVWRGEPSRGETVSTVITVCAPIGTEPGVTRLRRPRGLFRTPESLKDNRTNGLQISSGSSAMVNVSAKDEGKIHAGQPRFRRRRRSRFNSHYHRITMKLDESKATDSASIARNVGSSASV